MSQESLEEKLQILNDKDIILKYVSKMTGKPEYEIRNRVNQVIHEEVFGNIRVLDSEDEE